jgi:hypothetical protein
MSSCQPGIEETDLIEEQVDYWNEGSSIDLQEESRYGTSIDYQNVEMLFSSSNACVAHLVLTYASKSFLMFDHDANTIS